MAWLTEPVKMPRYVVFSVTVQAWAFIALFSLGAYLAVSVAAGNTLRTKEPPFSDDQRRANAEYRPGGTYVTDSLYRYCAGGVFWFADSAQREWNNGERCAAWMPSR